MQNQIPWFPKIGKSTAIKVEYTRKDCIVAFLTNRV